VNDCAYVRDVDGVVLTVDAELVSARTRVANEEVEIVWEIFPGSNVSSWVRRGASDPREDSSDVGRHSKLW
jgi:hypothetical protein